MYFAVTDSYSNTSAKSVCSLQLLSVSHVPGITLCRIPRSRTLFSVSVSKSWICLSPSRACQLKNSCQPLRCPGGCAGTFPAPREETLLLQLSDRPWFGGMGGPGVDSDGWVLLPVLQAGVVPGSLCSSWLCFGAVGGGSSFYLFSLHQ